MNPIKQLHRQAMEFVDQAFLAKLRGDRHEEAKLVREAFNLERTAAEEVTNDYGLEPTRSVLFRSAASLAMNCGELREAERLIALGIAGNPPTDVADELRDLLEEVYFARHVSLRGLKLAPGEFQLSMAGDAVGLGLIPGHTFIKRYQNLENLVHRTGERVRNEPFRERGPSKRAERGGIDLYVSVPRAASFAVTVRLVIGPDTWLPGLDPAEQVVKELMTCVELFNRSDEKGLRDRIPDQVYYRNFVTLARKMAPDGRDVKAVGLTAMSDDTEWQVLLTKPASELVPTPESTVLEEPKEEHEITVKGILKYANALGAQEIRLVENQETVHKVSVPEGMMADIVRPCFGKTVVIQGMKRGSTIHLIDIEELEE